jgi:hypothetical protein
VRENFPQRHQFLKGKVISYPFTTVLPGYQPQIGEVLKEKLGLGFIGGGFAFSLIGGLYLDFGVMSIILGMFFLGALLNFLYLKMKPDYQAFYVLLYCFTCVRALDAIRSYIFLNFSYFWVVFCLIAIHWYCTKKSQKWMNIKVVKNTGN